MSRTHLFGALQARRFGPVNWIGCWSLLRRQFKNGFSDLHYTILGPVISNALYLLLFVIASSSLTNARPARPSSPSSRPASSASRSPSGRSKSPAPTSSSTSTTAPISTG